MVGGRNQVLLPSAIAFAKWSHHERTQTNKKCIECNREIDDLKEREKKGKGKEMV
jgi:hypothetical protein